jgi:two-component system chemotaxis response regulator CheB
LTAPPPSGASGGRDIVVVGASLGGVEALQILARDLDGDLPAAVFVVLHMGSDYKSGLAGILDRAGPLPAVEARDGDPIRRGVIYLSKPDFHLRLEHERIRVVGGPKENYCRPAVDPLFRSAAAVYGSRVIGVVLTGLLRDGAAGLREVKHQGGVAVVQDPDDAVCPSMPQAALGEVKSAHRVPIRLMSAHLSQWVRGFGVGLSGVQPQSLA